MDNVLNELAVMLLAEGTVRKQKKGASIVFTNTSELLQSMFEELVQKLGYKTYQKSKKQKAVYSRKLGEQLMSLSKSFRTKPCASGKQNACPVVRGRTKLGPSCSICSPITFREKNFPPATFPESVINSHPNEITKYLRIFCSCEGGVVVGSDIRNDEVIVRVGHPTLRSQVVEMFNKIGIETKTRGTSLVFIRKRSEIKKFQEKVGFLDGVKAARGKYKGIEKNKLLEFVVNRHRPCKQARE
jgi:hypothetical protein